MCVSPATGGSRCFVLREDDRGERCERGDREYGLLGDASELAEPGAATAGSKFSNENVGKPWYAKSRTVGTVVVVRLLVLISLSRGVITD